MSAHMPFHLSSYQYNIRIIVRSSSKNCVHGCRAVNLGIPKHYVITRLQQISKRSSGTYLQATQMNLTYI